MRFEVCGLRLAVCGLETGDWRLETGDWRLGICFTIRNPKSKIRNKIKITIKYQT